jgi:hypothetical protein
MAARGYLGSGDLYINRIVGGIKQGIEGPFEVERFEIKANSELRERVSKSKSGYGQVVASASIPQPFDLAITMGEADATGLSIALLGTAAAVTQTSGTTTNTAVTTVLNKWVALPFARLTSAAQAVTNVAGTTTYVEGTDYILNRELGLIKQISTATMVAGPNHIDLAYAAITATEISGATASSIRAEFILDGKNLADDTPCIVTVFEGVVASDAAVDFLSDQFLTIPLPGRLVTPVGQTAPFKVVLRNAAA